MKRANGRLVPPSRSIGWFLALVAYDSLSMHLHAKLGKDRNMGTNPTAAHASSQMYARGYSECVIEHVLLG